MTTIRRGLEEHRFLRAFFGPGNDILLDRIVDTPEDEGPGALRPWVRLLAAGHAVVLPRKRGGRYDWYVVAPSRRSFRRLAEQITAFVGPSRSDFTGRTATPDRHDPVDAAAQDFTRGNWTRFRGGGGVWQALELMRRVWASSPGETREKRIPIGRVFRNFFTALEVGNRVSAQEQLNYIRRHHLLDSLNIAFLEVQMLFSLGQFRAVLELPDLPDLLKMRRPNRVTTALIEAVYQCALQPYADRGDWSGALSHFETAVYPEYHSLYTAYTGAGEPAVLKSLMLCAVNRRAPDAALRDRVLARAKALKDLSSADRADLQKIADYLPRPRVEPEADRLREALNAVLRGEYDRALDCVREAPPSLQRTRLLLECAYELQTSDAERAAVDAVRSLADTERTSFLGVRRNRELWRAIVDADEWEGGLAVEEIIPRDWIDWLHRLNRPLPWPRGRAIAHRGGVEWSLRDFLARPDNITEFVSLLQAPRESGNDAVLYNSLPHLFEFFHRDPGWPRPELGPVYLILLDLMTMHTEGGVDDLAVFNELAAALLGIGMEPEGYRGLVRNAAELWKDNASPAILPWILDLVDFLIVYPCPVAEVRSNLLIAVSNRIPSFKRHVVDAHADLLRLLHEDLGSAAEYKDLWDEEDAVTGEAATPLSKLDGKTVALYTLTKPVARRVQAVLLKRCPGIKCLVSHDKVGTDRLRQAARHADLFVVATASAKHAATGFIESNRPPHLPTIFPRGKGSAGMLQAIYEHLD